MAILSPDSLREPQLDPDGQAANQMDLSTYHPGVQSPGEVDMTTVGVGAKRDCTVEKRDCRGSHPEAKVVVTGARDGAGRRVLAEETHLPR